MIFVCINFLYVLNRNAVELFLEKRNGDKHAAVIIGNDRAESRESIDSRNCFHFFKVLMILRQAVLPRRFECNIRLGILVFGNHFLAAAAVACQRMAGQKRVGRDRTGFDKGIDK